MNDTARYWQIKPLHDLLTFVFDGLNPLNLPILIWASLFVIALHTALVDIYYRDKKILQFETIFLSFEPKTRLKVKTISIIYVHALFSIKEMFPNAKIIIDRFSHRTSLK